MSATTQKKLSNELKEVGYQCPEAAMVTEDKGP